MRRIALWVLALAVAAPALAAEAVPDPGMTLSQVIARNLAARGGLEAWRKVETMTWVGHSRGGKDSPPQMPFVLELKRPNKTHFEIGPPGQRFARVFDGVRGWKLRQGREGPDLRPFSIGEVKFAQDEFVIDGLLIDHEAKEIGLSLDGLDTVEGRKAYRLRARLPSTAERVIWVDAETFLEVRVDRPSWSVVTPGKAVSAYYRDYRTVGGLSIPFTIESRSSAGGVSETLVIDKVSINPMLPDRTFGKPAVPGQRGGVSTGRLHRAAPPMPAGSPGQEPGPVSGEGR